jgi:hypothetical protein
MSNEPPILKPSVEAGAPDVRAYAEIVALGFDCRVSYNLRRTFGFARAFPFDWWVTPLPALARFLGDPDAKRLYDPDLLQEAWRENDIFAIRNAHYDIELHHEFPRDRDSMVVADWRDHIDQPRRRTEYLLDRFLSLGSTPGPVLFVRSFKLAERHGLARRVNALVGECMAALTALFPALNYELLLVNPPEAVNQPRVFSLRIDDPNRKDWKGTPELWTAGLLEAGIAWTGPREAGIEPQPDKDQKAYV